MSGFQLDTRLRQDCHLLGVMATGQLLLLNNALFPWVILVPETDATEIYQLDLAHQGRVLEDINRICRVMEMHFEFDKINIGAIGNIVRQLHIHIIARSQNDACWPGVVWGTKHTQPYADDEVARFRELFGSICR